MADGIERTKCVVVLVNQNYMEKVGKGDAKDNCCFEFQYAHRIFGSEKIIPLVVESRMQNPATWRVVLGGAIGSNYYIDMTGHARAEVFDAKCEELLTKIERITGIDIRPRNPSQQLEKKRDAVEIAKDAGKRSSISPLSNAKVTVER